MTSRYYTMTDNTGASGFLPTVTFTSTNNVFTSAQRVQQLIYDASITGFYEADFANNITVIDLSAFAFDTKVVVATINGVTSIRSDAFYGCTALRAITLDCSVNTSTKKYLLTDISSGAFQGCTSLRNLHIPDTIKIIPDNMCNGCTQLEVAVMGYGWDRTSDTYNTTGTIGRSAFANCSKLSYFVVPETVGGVNDSAFANDLSLALVSILGTPDVSNNAFTGAMGTGAIYYYNLTKDVSNCFPAASTKRGYQEVNISGAAALTSTHVNTAITSVNSYWKGKILNSVTSLTDNCFRATTGITAAKYANMIGVSFPGGLTSIGYAAFGNTDGTTGTNCNVVGFYIPNSVTTFVILNGFNYTFWLTSTTLRDTSTTKQFVFQSGNTAVAFPGRMFNFSSAMAIIAPTATSFGSECFNWAKNVQLYSFFQKNAYTSTTRLDGLTDDAGNDAFTWNFNKGITGYTHYLYIPKQITRIASNAFRGLRDKLYVTAYHNSNLTTDTIGPGFGFFSYDATDGNSARFTGTTAPTINLIYNYYDANGLTLTTSSGIGSNFPLHVLYPSGVKTINNRLAGYTILTSIAVHHSATQTVGIDNAAFLHCTGLNYLYFNNRVKTIGYNAFRNAPLSNSFDLIDASPLETIYHATFYTDSGYIASNLKQITIPKTVKSIGSYPFGCGALNLKPAFTTLSFESGIAFWGDYDNTIGAATFTDVSLGSAKYMAIPAYLCYFCNYLTSVSFLNTVDANGNAISADASGALVRPDNSLPITTRYNSQILNPLIKRIGSYAFNSNYRLQSIRIPDGVTTIDTQAFLDAKSLSYLYLPDSLITMPQDNAAFNYLGTINYFGYTGKEVSVRIPQLFIDYVKADTGAITTGTFNSGNVATLYVTVNFNTSSGKVSGTTLGRFTTSAVNTYIKYHVIIQSGITSILGGSVGNARAFDGFTNLKTVNIPDSVTTIGAAAFYNCTSLTNAYISNTTNITAYTDSVFRDCKSLTDIYVGNNLQTIGVNALRNTPLNNTFDLSSATSLQAIYYAAFYTDDISCNLRQITIPKSVKYLGSYAFGCALLGNKPAFTTLSFENGITFWGDYNNALPGENTFTDTDTGSARYMAVPAFFCLKCNFLTSVSFLNTAIDLSGTPVPADASGALVRPNNSLPITTRYNSQILNPLIKRIGNNAFSANKRLQSIRIPDGVTSVDYQAFYDNYSLTYLYIPDSLTTMGWGAFNYMGVINEFGYTGKQSSVRLPQAMIDNVIADTGVATTGFFNPYLSNTRYFTVSFDNTSSKVTNNVLGRFTNVTGTSDNFYHIIIQPGISGILGGSVNGARAFDNYAGVKTVTIADTVTNIGPAAFYNTGLTNVFISPTSNLTIIDDSAFYNCTSLTSFFIPNSVKYIMINAFRGSTSLATVTYGDNPGLKYIGAQAFYDVTRALTSIFIPSSVVFIGSLAFIGGAGTNILNTITFGAGSRLRSIDYKCFGNDGNNISYSAQYLRDLVLPNGLRYMGIASSPLQNTHRLTHSANLIVPSSLDVIPWAFLYADNTPVGSKVDISNIYFPLSITNVAGPRKHNGYSLSGGLIGAEFQDSKAGSLIYLPSELSAYTGRSGYAFPDANRARSYYRTVSYTTNPLTTLGLGASVANTTNASTTSQIHAGIQEGVVVIGGGTTSIASASSGNALNLISVNIPSTVTDICANAFNGCSALAYVTFSENSHLTTIDSSGFSGCSLIHDIQLPDSLTTIGANAFNGCYNLASISIPYNVTSIGTGAFNINSSSPTTYIPRQGGYLAYQLGSNIYGEAISDYSGYSVSLSQDGKILAIGSVYNDAGGGDAGQVRIYKYQTITDTTWANYTVGSFSNTGTSPYNKPIVVNGGDLIPVSGKYYWVQLGMDINGETYYNFAGWSVSLSSDGTTVAIGAVVNYGAGSDAGQTRVYKYQTIADATWANYTTNSFTYVTNKPIVVNGGDANPVANKFYWVQLGADIDGEAANIQSGFSVALNSNGTTVVIGARYDDATATNSGSARIYQYSTGTWTKLGATLYGGTGTSANDNFGNSVSISDDGTIVAIAAQYFDSGTADTGIVRIFKYNGTAWNQLGSNIVGEATYDYSGESVSLSSDGTIVAIGAVANDGGGTDSGHVRIYKYNGTAWTQLGTDINGAAAYDEFGNSVSLSSDGTILAVGSRYSDTNSSFIDTGLARIYKYFNGTWQKLGQDIRGEFVSEITGCSVSLSKDGTTVAIGAYGNDISNYDSGVVRVYQISNFTVRLHQRLYDTIHASFSTYFPGISPGSVQVIPALTLTNTLNPANLTISQINNLYIRYRQSQLGGCTFITVSASAGGDLTASDVTTALSSSTGLVHLDISATTIAAYACYNNSNTSRIYSVAFAKTVTSIGFDAFNGCSNLTYLSFHPDSTCQAIRQGAFLGNNIIDLALPDSLTAISAWSFQNSNRLTSVCIPKNVTSLGLNAFYNCSKLTAVALPTVLNAANASYFNTDGINATSITFTTYSNISAIPHFKLSDYSTPNGIIQTIIDSAVTYIDHRAYAYYPDITLYAVTANKQTQTAGQYNYLMNGIKMPFQPAAFILNGGSFVSNYTFPIYRSVPDLNIFSLDGTTTNWIENTDDYYILMPGYSICMYNNLYDEENIFTDNPIYQYYDNEFGKVPLNITLSGLNSTSSLLIMCNGRILTKYFTT